MARTDLQLSHDRQQERAFDALAKRVGNQLVFNGRKVQVIASPVSYELVQDLVGFIPKRFADVEIKRSDVTRLGLTNENYVALDGNVLRVRKTTGDDITRHLVLHSTPDQGDLSSSLEESGAVSLAIDQVEVILTFRVVDPNSNYVFTECYIENQVDAAPLLDIDAVPGQRTATGRKLQLSGKPDTGNYVLRYKVRT